MASKDLIVVEEEKNKGGRPRIELTDAQLEELKILAPICTLQEIADYFGFGIETLKRLKANNEEVLSIYKKAKTQMTGIVGSALLKRAINGSDTAAIFYLKTRADGWKENKEEEIKDNKLEITVSIAENQNKENLARFDEMRNQRIKEKEAKLKEENEREEN